MKTVTVKKVRHLLEDRGPEGWIEKTAEDGVRVLVDGDNISGDDADYFASFRNADYESTDAYAVMEVLTALAVRGVIHLECDDDVKRAYRPNDQAQRPVEKTV